jgi:hypothetical protein
MEENKRQTRRSIFWPLMLVAVGVILLLTNLDALPGSLWDYIAKYWPLLFLLGGLDQIYQGKSWLGGTILLVLGGVLLAGNLNALPWSGLDLLLRLWPMLIVAAGLDLMMQGRTSLLGGIIVVVLAVGLLAGLVWVGFAGPGTLGAATLTVDQPLEGARSAAVQVTLISSDLSVTGGAQSDNLVDGTVYLSNQPEMSESYTISGGEGVYTLEPESNTHLPLFGPLHSEDSKLKLNSGIPTDVDLTLIAGEQSLDLRTIKATNVDMETIFGRSVITLPSSGRLNGKAGVIFGELVVRVPRGTAVEFQMDTALVGKNIPQDFLKVDNRIYSPEAADGNADIVLTLENVFGAVKIEYLP